MSDETQENMVDVEFRIQESLQRSLHSVTLRAFEQIKILILESALPSPLFVSEEKWDTFIGNLEEAEEMSKVGIFREIATLVSDAVDAPIEFVDLDAGEEDEEVEVQGNEEDVAAFGPPPTPDAPRVIGNIRDRLSMFPDGSPFTREPAKSRASELLVDKKASKTLAEKGISPPPFKPSLIPMNPTPEKFQVELKPFKVSTSIHISKDSLLDMLAQMIEQEHLRIPVPNMVEDPYLETNGLDILHETYSAEVRDIRESDEEGFVLEFDLVKAEDKKLSSETDKLSDLWTREPDLSPVYETGYKSIPYYDFGDN
jgi:hypothetical protein